MNRNDYRIYWIRNQGKGNTEIFVYYSQLPQKKLAPQRLDHFIYYPFANYFSTLGRGCISSTRATAFTWFRRLYTTYDNHGS